MATGFQTLPYLKRVSSYRKFPEKDAEIFCTTLAQNGYIYTGEQFDVRCEGCHITVQVDNVWSVTKTRLRHESGCVFNSSALIEADEEKIDLVSNSLPGGSDIHADAASANHGFGDFENDLEIDGTIAGAHASYDISSSGYRDDKTSKPLSGKDVASVSSLTSSLSISTESQASSLLDQFERSTLDLARDYFDFSEMFRPECMGLDFSKTLKTQNTLKPNCEKNPGHFAYFLIPSLRLDHLPRRMRCDGLLRALQLMSDLTVKVVTACTSKLRPRDDVAITNPQKARLGTGFVIEQPCLIDSGAQRLNKSTLKFWKQLMSQRSHKNVGAVYVQTSRHVIFDDEEAQKTEVQFFSGSSSDEAKVTLVGKRLLSSPTPGDGQCLLVCECPDLVFIQRLNLLQKEFFKAVEELPLKVKKGMLKTMFIVHHPHGGPKVLSFGDHVKVKYIYNTGESKHPTLTKLTPNDHVSSDVALYRKALLYVADTCSGSSGAPVLMMSAKKTEGTGHVTFRPDIWMHNGVEATHSLGVSKLKNCTVEDFQQIAGQWTDQDDDSEDEASPGNQKVNSPVYKVITSMAHPDFAMYETRLNTFRTWAHKEVIAPEKLALSGFHFTGESDCVVCFQCGLGLRAWKQGDDVMAEHKKYSPSCPYLATAADRHEEMWAGSGEETESGTRQSAENIEVKLLKSENLKLKDQLLCKMCHKSEIKDVFLPCGELYACSDCSKLVTHCPSCKKQILATVTVYLT
ncbi:Baculoviral IAP repeat-containing protein 7-B [Biomphalaria glabrata]|nr:hypothetical protein BgiMline_009604 [Biomphalaria glabrata]